MTAFSPWRVVAAVLYTIVYPDPAPHDEAQAQSVRLGDVLAISARKFENIVARC